jgi:hypothetical protein
MKARSHPIAGTWAFVASEWKRADGKHANPFGEGAVGLLTYDESGHMSVHIMRRGRPLRPDLPPTIDAAFAAAVPGYLAYFGAYDVDEQRSIVTHTVIASSFPAWVGGQHQRRFEIDGERLTLRDDLVTSDGVAVAAATIWRRMT